MNLVPKAIPIQNNVTAALTATLLLFLSCDQGVTSPLPSSSLLENLVITQTYYDSVRVQSGKNFVLRFQNVERISIGEQTDSGYTELATTKPIYSAISDGYLTTFDVKAKSDSSLIIFPLRAKYHFRDGTTNEVSRNISTLQYPYPSAEVFVTGDEVSYWGVFQDIDRIGDKLYYHPLGAGGLYEYDLVTRQTREMLLMPGGDHIAADSIFIFIDFGHRDIFRYNLDADSVERWFIRFTNTVFIRGMDTYNNMLYVLTDATRGNLLRYSYNGEFIDAMDFPFESVYITIHNGILYIMDYPDHIRRFDLATKTFLPSIQAPTILGDGIKISEGYFYFCDLRKRLVGRVPIEDIE